MSNHPAFDAITFIFTVAGMFSIIDSLTPKHVRLTLSNFIFGVHGLQMRDFENALVHIWISMFVKDGRVSVLRCFGLSVFLGVALLFFVIITQGSEGLLDPSFYAGSFFMIAAMGIFGTPFEVINIWISRKIYMQWMPDSNISFKYFADLALSLGLVTLTLLFIIFILKPVEDWFFGLFVSSPILGITIGIFVLSPLFSAVFFLATRGLIMLAGITLRALFVFANLNTHAAVITNAANVPLTYLALVGATLFVVITSLIGAVW